MQEVDWRGFRLPWIYTVDDDLFIRPAPPPSADSLSLEPWIVEDNWGEEIELERPTALPLDDEAQAELDRFNNGAWEQLQAEPATRLFERQRSEERRGAKESDNTCGAQGGRKQQKK